MNPRAAALVLCLAFAVTSPAISERRPSETGDEVLAPFPFTPESIRAFNTPGTVITMEARNGGDRRIVTIRWTDADEESGEFEETSVDAATSGLSRATIRRTWVELQHHASYPIDKTTIQPARLHTAAGEFDCQLYEVETSEGVERYWFAKQAPGLPVRTEVELGGRLTRSIEVVSIEH